MRTKKLLSIILTVLFVTSWLNGFDISVFADYSNADGIIQWDFAEYTDKITTTEAGFTEAWATIVDSNLTTLVAAFVLLYFGTGPVRGFAVTLAIGIATSMFTSVTVTRLIITGWLQKYKPTKLPI